MQGAEFKCSEALVLLSPLFTTWCHIQKKFDSLVPLLPQKKDLRKGVIINARKVIHRVKELHGFFIGKMQLIQGKMKTISMGILNFIPNILDVNGFIKEWQEWSSSFEHILRHLRFVSYYNNEIDVIFVYDMVDFLFRIESNMRKVTGELKAITNIEWKKGIYELDTIRDATWPNVNTDIAIWEVIVDIISISLVESD